MSNSFNLDLFRRTYQGPTIRVKLVAAENAASYLPAIPFTSSKDVMDYFSTLEEEPREIVIAAYLDNKHRFLAIEEVSRGTLTASLFEPRAILQGCPPDERSRSHHGPQSPVRGSETERRGSVRNELSKTVNRRNADPAPRPHHHWPEELLFTARLRSPLSKQAGENGKTHDGYESIAPKIPPGASGRHAGSAKSAGGSKSECF